MLCKLTKQLKHEEEEALQKQAKLELEKTHMVNRYLQKLGVLDGEHQRILDKLNNDHL